MLPLIHQTTTPCSLLAIENQPVTMLKCMCNNVIQLQFNSFLPASLPFLEVGSSDATLTGSLPRGSDVYSDPIPINLTNGFPFSNSSESVIYVSLLQYSLCIEMYIMNAYPTGQC